LPKGGVVSEPSTELLELAVRLTADKCQDHAIKASFISTPNKEAIIADVMLVVLMTSNRTPAITQPESNEHKPSALPLGDAGKLVEALDKLVNWEYEIEIRDNVNEAFLRVDEKHWYFQDYYGSTYVKGMSHSEARVAAIIGLVDKALAGLAGTSKGDGEDVVPTSLETMREILKTAAPQGEQS
jgi:hypothetical protein